MQNQLLICRVKEKRKTGIGFHSGRGQELFGHMHVPLASPSVDLDIEQENKYSGDCLFLERIGAFLYVDGTRPVRDRLDEKLPLLGRPSGPATQYEQDSDQPADA